MLWLGPIEELWASLGAKLSPEREPWVFAAAEQLGPARQRTFMTGRALLKHALQVQGILAADEQLPELTTSKLGRPSLPETLGCDFNLSHAHGFMTLSLASGPQGVDLELAWPDLKRPTLSLSERVLGAEELATWQKLYVPVATELNALGVSPERGRVPQVKIEALSSAAQAALGEACLYFKRQWTLREAMVKLIGSSIFALDHMVVDVKGGICGFKRAYIPRSADADDEASELLAMLMGKTLPQGAFVSALVPEVWDLSVTGQPAQLVVSWFVPDAAPQLSAQLLVDGKFEARALTPLQQLQLCLV